MWQRVNEMIPFSPQIYVSPVFLNLANRYNQYNTEQIQILKQEKNSQVQY